MGNTRPQSNSRTLPSRTGRLRIGLFGGSFDPPHIAHRLVSLIALRRLRLDAVWWLVSPGNPLKKRPPSALEQRLRAARQISCHPRLVVSDVEQRLGTRYTADTLAALVRRYRHVRFVWIMGADNMAGFQTWQHWQRIALLMPVAVVDRPGATHRAVRARAAQALAAFRLKEEDAGALASRAPPAWVFLHGPRSNVSSTRLRTQPFQQPNAQGIF